MDLYSVLTSGAQDRFAAAQERLDAERRDMLARRQRADDAAAGAEAGYNTLLDTPLDLPQMPITPQLSPMAIFLASLAGNMNTAITGNQSFRNNTNEALDTAAAQNRQDTQRQTLLDREALNARRSELLTAQAQRMRRLQERADKMGDDEAAAAYATKEKALLKELEHMHALVEGKATADAAMARQDAGDAAAMDRAQLAARTQLAEAGIRYGDENASFLPVKDWQSARKDLLNLYTNKSGQVTDPAAMRSHLAWMPPAEGTSVEQWFADLMNIKVKTAFGEKPLFDPKNRVHRTLVNNAANRWFPEEEEGAGEGGEGGGDDPVLDAPAGEPELTPVQAARVQKLTQEAQTIINDLNRRGGPLKAARKQQGERRLRKIKAELEALGLMLEVQAPQVEGIEVR